MLGCRFGAVNLTYMKWRLSIGILWLLFLLCLIISIIGSLNGVSITKFSEIASTIVTLAIGLVSIVVTEVSRSKDRSALVFKNMNKVFVQDKNIQAVIRYLNQKETDEPKVNELELFLRFFEELDVYMRKGDINKHIINDLFYYYCRELIHSEECRHLRDKMEFNLNDWKYLKHIDKIGRASCRERV